MISLTAKDPVVLDLTAKALLASRSMMPILELRCVRGACGDLLGGAAVTPFGPLLTTSWTVPVQADLAVDGSELSLVKFNATMKARGATLEGDIPVDRKGTVILLQLPSNVAQDFPDVIVRCRTHGYAQLERLAVLDALRQASKRKRQSQVSKMGVTCGAIDNLEFEDETRLLDAFARLGEALPSETHKQTIRFGSVRPSSQPPERPANVDP